MEEDIKILEKKLKEWEPYKNIKWATEIERQIGLENQAIQNLIARYKELEEENIHWKGQYHLLSRKIDVIPKSKVQEKIEWLEEISDNGMNAVRFAATYEDEIERKERQKCISRMIEILQELIED